MTNLLKITTNAILVAGLTIFAAGAASAASSSGAGNGNDGRANGGRGSDGPGNFGGDNPGIGEELIRQDVHKPRYGMIIQRYRRNVVIGDQTCASLFFLINRSNMMKTVPDYQECLRKNGS